MTTLKTAMLCAALLCLSTGLASAGCEVVATNGDTGARVFQCEAPTAPSVRPKCTNIAGVLLCDGEIGQSIPRDIVTPRNCAWRKGKYVCS